MAQLILTWSPPADCSGCTYEYRYKLSSASTYVTGATSNTIVTINNLIDAQTYNYSVRTICPDAGGNLRSRWVTQVNGLPLTGVTCNTNPPLQPTPTPTITPTPTATGTPTPTPTPTATVSVPTATPTPTPTPTVTTPSCLTGTLYATGNCSGSETSTFTLASGYQATITPTGFFYSGTGTRYAYAYLRTNTGTNIQTFTLTQVNSSVSYSPSTYTLTTPGTYQLYGQQVDCAQNGGTGGSGSITLTVGNCQVSSVPTVTPTPTPTSVPLNRFYIASPVADIDETYCVTPGYVLTGALWSYATTVSGLMNQQVYIDQYGDDVFVGVEGYKYGISLTAGINTYTDGTSNYYLIQIDQYGYVYNVLAPNCRTSGGGGDVPL